MLLCSFILITIPSCVGSKQVFNLHYDRDKGKQAGIDDFVKLNDGTVVKEDVQKSKIHLGISKNGTITTANKTYDVKDVTAYQMDSIFRLKATGKKYFYGRKKSGRINLYYRHFTERGTDTKGRFYDYSYDLHWLQKGDDGSVQMFSVKLLSEMVADNSQAVAFIDQYKSSRKKDSSLLDMAIDTYNGK